MPTAWKMLELIKAHVGFFSKEVRMEELDASEDFFSPVSNLSWMLGAGLGVEECPFFQARADSGPELTHVSEHAMMTMPPCAWELNLDLSA